MPGSEHIKKTVSYNLVVAGKGRAAKHGEIPKQTNAMNRPKVI